MAVALMPGWNRGDPALMEWVREHGLDPHAVVNVDGCGIRKAVASVAVFDADGQWIPSGRDEVTFTVRRPLPRSAVEGLPGDVDYWHGIELEPGVR